MGNKKPTLTKAAARILEDFCQSTKSRVYNIAEKKVLDEARKEINETDIIEALKIVSITILSKRRKWAIRILIMTAVALLGIQISAFYQLFPFTDTQELSAVAQMWAVFPTVFILGMVIVFSWIFKDDWL